MLRSVLAGPRNILHLTPVHPSVCGLVAAAMLNVYIVYLLAYMQA